MCLHSLRTAVRWTLETYNKQSAFPETGHVYLKAIFRPIKYLRYPNPCVLLSLSPYPFY
jgi:hypothetical protein